MGKKNANSLCKRRSRCRRVVGFLSPQYSVENVRWPDSLRSKRFRAVLKKRVKGRAKNGASTRAGTGWERKVRKRLQANPGLWKLPICPLMPECAHRHLLSSAVINWPIKCLAFVERKWIFQDACGTKNSFFVFRKQRMDSGNGEISMNRIKGTFLFLIRLKGWNPRVKFWSFSSKLPESWIGGSKMWRAFKSIFDLRRGYLYKVVKAPLPFSPRRRTTRLVLVNRINKHRRKFMYLSVWNKPFIDTCQHLNYKGSIARRPNQQKYTLSRHIKDCKADNTTRKLTLQDVNTTPK